MGKEGNVRDAEDVRPLWGLCAQEGCRKEPQSDAFGRVARKADDTLIERFI
jgi:hypothetical protein